MQLKKININNFRSIKNSTFDCNHVTALVGENNSGKSAVLRALNAFFNYSLEEKYFFEGLHQYSNKSFIRIEITFDEVPDKDIYTNKLHSNEQLILRMTYSNKTKKRTLNYKKDGNYTLINNDSVFISKLKEDINYVLIPTNRDKNQVTWNENALLKVVLEEYLSIYTSKRDTLTPKVKEAAQRLERVALSKVENSLEEFYSLNKNFKFKFSYDNLLDYSILLNDITLNIEEKGQQYNITESGSGIQSLTIIALYRYLAELKHNNIILGIEEPEINLHPQAQREFIKSIKEHNSDNEIQIIFTTHSAVIADQLDHHEIILFRKSKDKTRGFKTVGYQVPSNFWEIYGIEEFKYYQFYRYRNSEFFFAKFIIIVESKNDAEVVRYLLSEKDIDPDLYGVSIINLEGVKNLVYPYYLLKHLNIPHFIILDKDFFVPYINDSLELSRYDSGFPKYKNEFKNIDLIKQIIKKTEDRDTLLTLFNSNHSKAMDLLEKYNIISLKYNLETDLIASKTATKVYYDILDVPHEQQEFRTQSYLLTRRHKQIKKIGNIMRVIKRLHHRNLPNSYKRIKRVVSDRIKQLNS